MIILEQNPKLGYYTYDGKKFFGKVRALIEATKANRFPEWNFNREIFDKIDWTQEPVTPLTELYKLRAQQIRDRYDYIRLEFSGGGDSSTVLYSFVNNGIHLDEVIFRYPKTGEKNVTDDPYNYKPENTLSEFRYAAQPALQWLATAAPRTKIVIHDYTENMLSQTYEEDWVFRTKDYFQPGHCFKHDPMGLIEHRRLADQGKRICMLYGVDKPKICIKDKKWYLYFMDIMANHSNGSVGDYTNLTNEYFFWSPDLPELIAKQAHIIIKWFDLPTNQHTQYLCRWPNYSYTQRTAYEHIVKPLIYPDYDPTTFQTSKPTNSFYNEMDHWFYINFQDTPQYQRWQAGLKFLVDNIDRKYFNYEMNRPVGFVGFISPFYYLGDAVFTDRNINTHFKF